MTRPTDYEEEQAFEYWCRKIVKVCYTIVAVAFSVLALSWLLYRKLAALSPFQYWTQIIIPPCALLLVLSGIVDLLLRVKKIPVFAKIYITMILTLVFCIVVATFKTNMITMLVSFCVPVFVSTIFSNLKLTRNIYFLSQISLLVCAAILSHSVYRDFGIWLLPETLTASGILISAYCLTMVLIKFTIHNQENLRRAFDKQQDMNRRIQHDVLTGLYSRAMFNERLPHLIMESNDSKKILALAVLDLDHFKEVNDTFGHGVGDQVLKRLAAVLLRYRGGGFSAYRIGGEEFALLMTGYSIERAVKVCQNLNCIMGATYIEEIEGYVTFSCGVALLEEGMDAQKLFDAADAALYEAKNSGRNKVAVPQASKLRGN
ncbi:MAG: GGDEF domain-containing protein [Clostridiaceae bacterium]|nr:GGDEF domain-containing protein [Clostridiaceae bacterium]